MTATQKPDLQNDPAEALRIIVYSRSGCVQCKTTAQFLTRAGISHDYIDLDQAEGAMDILARLGYRQLPVVTVRKPEEAELMDHWSGFRPDKLNGLKALLAASGRAA